MPIYVTRTCPHCQNQLEWGRDYVAIGSPFGSCSYCHGSIMLSHITEWRLLSPKERFFYILIHIKSTFLMAFIFVFWLFVLLLVLGWLLGPAIDTLSWFLYSFPVVALVAVILSFTNLRNAIHQSNQRMADSQYLARLRQHGFLPNDRSA